QYSLKALYVLARNYGREPVLVADLAAEEAIPRQFLHRILWSLRNAGLASSKKGRHGGYVLAKSPEEITVASVVRSTDGPLEPLPCATRTGPRTCRGCSDAGTCSLRAVATELHEAMARILDRTTLADVCGRVDQARLMQVLGPDR